MENTYGIGVANRYDLFMLGEDDMTDFETVVKKKNLKKTAAAAAMPASAGTPVAPAASKVAPQKAAGNAGNKENKQIKKTENGTGTTGERRGIKEQNNKDNLSTIQRKDGECREA